MLLAAVSFLLFFSLWRFFFLRVVRWAFRLLFGVCVFGNACSCLCDSFLFWWPVGLSVHVSCTTVESFLYLSWFCHVVGALLLSCLLGLLWLSVGFVVGRLLVSRMRCSALARLCVWFPLCVVVLSFFGRVSCGYVSFRFACGGSPSLPVSPCVLLLFSALCFGCILRCYSSKIWS